MRQDRRLATPINKLRRAAGKQDRHAGATAMQAASGSTHHPKKLTTIAETGRIGVKRKPNQADPPRKAHTRQST
jgi:hypothetical protein